MTNTTSGPTDDVTQLRARITDLEQQVNSYQQTHFQLLAQIDLQNQLLDAISDIVIVKDADSRIIYANQAFHDFFQTTIDELNEADAARVRDGNISQYLRDDQYVQSTGETLHIAEEEGRRPDGSPAFFNTIKSPIRNPDGSVRYTVGVSRDITERRTTANELGMFKSVVENAPDAIGLSDMNGKIFYANAAQQTMSGYGTELFSMNFYDLYPKEEHPIIDAAAREVVERGVWQGVLNWKHKDGRRIPVLVTVFMLHNAQNETTGFVTFIRDMSEQQRAEEERLSLQEQVIAAQQAALRELSTPLIPLADNVIAMPLIGSIDSQRAQQVIETLLDGVSSTHARAAIIDITGVPVVDTQVANALLRAAQAVKLLGARVVLTGIRPEVAQTLVGLGVDLGGIVTRSTLQSGIAFALQQAA